MIRRQPTHDRDAGGDPQVLERKAALRERVWEALQDGGAARFPGAHGRIPNFTGAEDAAERLQGLEVWRSARSVKANPDSPQWPVRQRAIEDGMTVLVAVPRLADARPFLRLDPASLAESARAATSIRGASRNAEPVGIPDIGTVDLVVVGSVAVSPDGARLGKGGGFSDLEFALLREAGLVGADTPVVTTVHERQVVEEGTIPMTDHDVPVDVVVTPSRVVTCRGGHVEPAGIRWDELTEEKVAAIPVLGRLRR